jgi:hypothetical protein
MRQKGWVRWVLPASYYVLLVVSEEYIQHWFGAKSGISRGFGYGTNICTYYCHILLFGLATWPPENIHVEFYYKSHLAVRGDRSPF